VKQASVRSELNGKVNGALSGEADPRLNERVCFSVILSCLPVSLFYAFGFGSSCVWLMGWYGGTSMEFEICVVPSSNMKIGGCPYGGLYCSLRTTKLVGIRLTAYLHCGLGLTLLRLDY